MSVLGNHFSNCATGNSCLAGLDMGSLCGNIVGLSKDLFPPTPLVRIYVYSPGGLYTQPCHDSITNISLLEGKRWTSATNEGANVRPILSHHLLDLCLHRCDSDGDMHRGYYRSKQQCSLRQLRTVATHESYRYDQYLRGDMPQSLPGNECLRCHPRDIYLRSNLAAPLPSLHLFMVFAAGNGRSRRLCSTTGSTAGRRSPIEQRWYHHRRDSKQLGSCKNHLQAAAVEIK